MYKTCKKCKTLKSVTEFCTDRSKKDGLTGACKSCRSYRGQRSSLYGFCVAKLTESRNRARRKGLPHEIGLEFIVGKVSNGKCELTGWPLRIGGGKFDFNMPSLDRKDSRRGYVPDNVRVVCWGVNNMLGEYGEDKLVEVAEAIRNKR